MRVHVHVRVCVHVCVCARVHVCVYSHIENNRLDFQDIIIMSMYVLTPYYI